MHSPGSIGRSPSNRPMSSMCATPVSTWPLSVARVLTVIGACPAMSIVARMFGKLPSRKRMPVTFPTGTQGIGTSSA